MESEEREQLELAMEFYPEVRSCVGAMEEVVAELVVPLGEAIAAPPLGLKEEILFQASLKKQVRSEVLVRTDPDGFVQWVNDEFTEMCGYSEDQACGKRLGSLLQGEATDLAVAERLKTAVATHSPCKEIILNYRKDGTPYWVSIEIAAMKDEDGSVCCLLAREHLVPDLPVPARSGEVRSKFRK